MNWKKRSTEKEIMDDLQLEGEELIQTLQEIDKINKWLGGFGALVQKIEEALTQYSGSVTITDMGCGSGWLLKQLEKKNWEQVTLVGLDANAAVTKFAKQDYSGKVQFKNADVFEYMKSLDEKENNMVISSLFCHHFNNEELNNMLLLAEEKKVLFMANDLQRNPLALELFKLVGFVFRLSNMAKIDGAISIKRSFVKLDWQKLFSNFQSEKYSIEWKWAFRYLVVLDLRNKTNYE